MRRRYSKKYAQKKTRKAVRRALNGAKSYAARLWRGDPNESYKRGSEWSKGTFGTKAGPWSPAQIEARKAFRFKGEGAYSVGRFMRDASTIGEGIKKTYNSWIPKSIRDQAVGMASSALGKFSGSGLYTGRGAYQSNELVEGGMPSMDVMGGQDETETIYISNREYVTDVYGPGSSAFTNQSLYLNPGLQQNFPWLSQIAINYEEYDFDKLIFIYRSTIDIGNANTTGQSGSVIMVCDYNAAHAPFDSKEAMMQYHGAVSGKATDDLVCGIECDPNKTNMNEGFVRSSPVPYGEDIKTYDHGVFQFALVNIPTAMQNQQLGELWVEYSVRLRKPKLAVSRGMSIQQDVFVSGQSAWNGTLTVPAANPLGPNRSQPMGDPNYLLKGRANNIGCSLSFAAPNIILITFPASLSGIFKITFQVQMYVISTAQSGYVGVTTTGNAAPYYDMYGSAGLYSGIPNWVSTSVSNNGIALDVDIKLNAATGGVNNTLTLDCNTITQTLGLLGAGYWRSSQPTITEMNPSFASSGTNSAPQLVNSTGTIATPLFY